MKEIKMLDVRKKKGNAVGYRYSLFECPVCNEHVEKVRYDGLRAKACSHKCFYGTRKGEVFENYAVIPLTQGKTAKVDVEDYEDLVKFNWSFGKDGYAVRNERIRPNSDQVSVRMHSVIIEAPSGFVVDHINGDKIDNRKINLRICKHEENLRNRGKQSNNTSGYKGVSWNKGSEKWAANIKVNGKLLYLGLFSCKHDAAKAYNDKALEVHGDFAVLNEIIKTRTALNAQEDSK